MKHTDRIKRINAGLDKHFKSNKGAWWVNNEPFRYGDQKETGDITLHRGIGGDRIKPIWIALYIFRTEPSVHYIKNNAGWDTWVYTRETLRRAGYKL